MKRTLFLFVIGLLTSLTASASMVALAACVPPVASEYVGTLQQFHQGWPIGAGHIEFSDPSHRQFNPPCNPLPPSVPGSMNTDVFASTLLGTLTTNGLNPTAISAPAGVSVNVTFVSEVGALRTFNTEITQFDVSGGNLPPNIRLRQSATQPTLGQTTVQDLGGGRFRIDSFFDVFTDLSLDGGQTWIPSDRSGHVELQALPEPSTVLLLGMGVGLLAARRRLSRLNKNQ